MLFTIKAVCDNASKTVKLNVNLENCSSRRDKYVNRLAELANQAFSVKVKDLFVKDAFGDKVLLTNDKQLRDSFLVGRASHVYLRRSRKQRAVRRNSATLIVDTNINDGSSSSSDYSCYSDSDSNSDTDISTDTTLTPPRKSRSKKARKKQDRKKVDDSDVEGKEVTFCDKGYAHAGASKDEGNAKEANKKEGGKDGNKKEGNKKDGKKMDSNKKEGDKKDGKKMESNKKDGNKEANKENNKNECPHCKKNDKRENKEKAAKEPKKEVVDHGEEKDEKKAGKRFWCNGKACHPPCFGCFVRHCRENHDDEYDSSDEVPRARLALGSKGKDVKMLQSRLNELGFLDLEEVLQYGLYCHFTARAVKQFRTAFSVFGPGDKRVYDRRTEDALREIMEIQNVW